MASIYPNTRLTNYGRELIARSQATGKKLQYIKLVTGDGQLDNQNIDTMTSVIAPKLECPFTSNGEFVGDGQFRIEFAVGNSTVTNGFFARELGVYANLEGESDTAAKLIAYSNGGNYASYIPSKETPINSKVFSLDVVIGNSTNVTVKKIDAAYLTRGALDAHSRDTSAHAPITDQIKAILGSANWKDAPASTLVTIKNLLGQGAIVASKLDANAGFVKFANGFTIQWVLFNANNQPKPWTVRYPIEFANKTIAVSATRYNGEYAFSEIILSTSRNQLTYKDSDYRGQQGFGDQIMFIIIGN